MQPHNPNPRAGDAPASPLPCPFCGGRAVTERAWQDAISVVCTGCGAVAVHRTARSRGAVIAAWNARRRRVNLQRQSAAAPCPFCASGRIAAGGRGQAVLTCQTCGMMISFATADTRAAALRGWNRRV